MPTIEVARSSPNSAPHTQPWDRPFWKPVPQKAGVLFYLLLIHLLAAVGLVLFPAPGLLIAGLALAPFFLGGLGTTVCYHRTLAHRTLTLNKVVEHFLIFCAMFNGSGAPASWVTYHRMHHARTDTPDDISSPRQGGFWWAHLRWLYQSAPANTRKWSVDLNRPSYRFWTHAEVPVLLLSLCGGLALGWPGFFWLGAIRLVYSLHMQCLVNSLTHLGHTEHGNCSQSVWWLGPFQLAAWGENWHRNHHLNAGSARLGLLWWQIDVGWYFICALEAVGLAGRVKQAVSDSATRHRASTSASPHPRYRPEGDRRATGFGQLNPLGQFSGRGGRDLDDAAAVQEPRADMPEGARHALSAEKGHVTAERKRQQFAAEKQSSTGVHDQA